MDLKTRLLEALKRSADGGAREGRALVVTGSPRGASPELLCALAGACGYTAAVDSGLRWLEEAGIAPDAAVGDMDSVDPAALERLGAGVEVYRVDAVDKDVTDLELALGFIRGKGFEEAVVANFAGGRLDHLLASVGALERAGMRTVAVDDDVALVPLGAGEEAPRDVRLAGLGLENGDVYSVLALGGPATVVQEGARYPQEGGAIGYLSGLGISNVVEDAPAARVAVESGTAAVIIPL